MSGVTITGHLPSVPRSGNRTLFYASLSPGGNWGWACMLVLSCCLGAEAATLLHWGFEGALGGVLSSDTDTQAGATLTKFNDATLPGGATNTVKYGPPNPWFNHGGTSAEFLNTAGVNDPGVGLFCNDKGTNELLDLSTFSNLTMEAFVCPYDLRQAVVLRKTSSSNNGYLIELRQDGFFGFLVNATAVVVTNRPVSANTWYHLALVKDAAASQVRFYVNGEVAANVPFSGTLIDTPNSLGVGTYARDNVNPPANSGQFFYGCIDELRISDEALVPSQFLFNLGSTNPVAIQKTQSFDTASAAALGGWVELGTRANSQNYGFSATANAGEPAGEAGGVVARKSIRSSYCDVFGGPLTLDEPIIGGGSFVLTATPVSGNASVLFGHGDSTKVGTTSEANQLGIVLATTSPPGLYAHLTFSTGASSRFEQVVDNNVVPNQVYYWDYVYDPQGNAGNGAVTVRTSRAGTAVTNAVVLGLSGTQRALGANFDSFGMTQRALSDASPAPVSTSFIDNLVYTALTTGPRVQFERAASTVLESAGSGGVNVVLSAPVMNPVTVQYAVTGGSATGGGVDYNLPNGTLTFPPGVTNQVIPIAIVYDGLAEPNETVELTLSNSTGVGLGATSKHVLTIISVDLLKLMITKSSGTLLVKWPASFWNYQLQYEPDLLQPAGWQVVTNLSVISNGWRQVSLPPTGSAGFFRLVLNNSPMPTFTNSIGMKLVQVPAGTFTMGYWQSAPLDASITSQGDWVPSLGDYDERPAHQVTISHPFWLGAYEVSNKEYEQFDPTHALLRGKLGFSTNDNEAVVFVTWNDAKAFCDWLAAREGLPYRLPTEAEWEYACRAGTTTHFSMGDTLPSQYLPNPGSSWWPTSGSPTALFRGQTPPNPWGLYDMHGNVEEWCSDWYGPYAADAQTDPVGCADGISKVSRGGSHSTLAFYLRSENRMGTLPEDSSWYIGIRVVMGNAPATAPLPAAPPSAFQTGVSQAVPANLTNGPDPNLPYFCGPLRYVQIPSGSYGPVYSGHNHDAGGIVECPNGDLLALWYTCVTETGRELALAASRLRYGAINWDIASSFYDVPDRNDHGPSLWFDGNQTLYHINGLSAAATWGPLASVLQTSSDNGVTWTKPRLIAAEHNIWHLPGASFIRTASGALLFCSDAGTGGSRSKSVV